MGTMNVRSGSGLALALVGLLAPAGASLAACGGAEQGGAKMPTGAHAKGLDHEACPESGNKVEGLDTNGDGKEDIRRVSDKSGHEICRIADLNHDGKPDLYEYFDASGAVRRR